MTARAWFICLLLAISSMLLIPIIKEWWAGRAKDKIVRN